MRQLIKYLDPRQQYIIHDLDEKHLFVDANFVRTIQKQVDEFVEQHVYDATAEREEGNGK
jgi:hypothetical protein